MKFLKRHVYLSFRDNIWGADLADVQLIDRYTEGFHFLLCVIGIFSKRYFSRQKNITTINIFQNILDESGHNSNKIWVNKCSEFLQ